MVGGIVAEEVVVWSCCPACSIAYIGGDGMVVVCGLGLDRGSGRRAHPQ